MPMSYADYYNQTSGGAPSQSQYSYGGGPPQIGYKPNGHRGMVPGPMYQRMGDYSYGIQNPGMLGYGREAPPSAPPSSFPAYSYQSLYQPQQSPPSAPTSYGSYRPPAMRRRNGMMYAQPWWMSDQQYGQLHNPQPQPPMVGF